MLEQPCLTGLIHETLDMLDANPRGQDRVPLEKDAENALRQTEVAAVEQMNIELEETVAKNRPGPCTIKLARLANT